MSGAEPRTDTPYDTVRYPSYTHSPSHIDRLATQATLFGLDPAPPTHCRVLELGCGSGGNLVPMAYGLPGSRFVGIDYAAGPIAEAKRMAAEIGVDNVEFLHADILDLDGSLGVFDYVIAHGVFSWVPPEVADKILALCDELLAPNGLAFVSYLAYPGSHARQMLREILLFHLHAVEDPATVQAEAASLAAWLVSTPAGGDPGRAVLHADANRFLTASPDYLFHDDLAEWNVPQYFTQFVNAAGAHALQFVAEADPFEMEAFDLSDEARERLDVLSPTRLLREQYLDFARARRFRQTILSRAAAPVLDSPDPGRVASLYVSSSSPRPDDGIDLAPGVEVSFEGQRGSTLNTHYALGKAALDVLIDAAPRRLAVEMVEAAARERLAAVDVDAASMSASPSAELHEFLLRLYTAGYVTLHTTAPALVSDPGDQPRVNGVARWQAVHGDYLTTLTHVGYTYTDAEGRRLIPLMDGTRDRLSLLAALDLDDVTAVDRNLTELARLGFLEA